MSKALDLALPAALLAVFGLFWEGAVLWWGIPSYILPGPLEVGRVLVDRLDILATHSLTTLLEIGLGFGLALVVGVALAVLIHVSARLRRCLLPLVIASQTVPVFAVAPLLVLWFGYGIWSKVVMTALIVFFPITVNTVRGLSAADPDLLALFTILEATPMQVFCKVRIPGAMPQFFSGVRIGVAVSTIGAVIGEWVGARQGLGFLMVQANAQLQVGLVFAAIGCLSLMGIILYVLVGLTEKALLPRGLQPA